MTIDTDRIDDAVLALLHLTLQDENSAGKGLDSEALRRLHQKGLIDDPAGQASTVKLTGDGLQRSKALFDKMFAKPAVGPCKYPHIKVDLSDLVGQLWPILRRVSYAMSDADVSEEEIERYKVEVRAGGDPIEISGRWVNVERAAN